MAIYFDKVYNMTKCIRRNSTGAFIIIKYNTLVFRKIRQKEEAIRSVQDSEKNPSENFIPLVLLYYYIVKNTKVKFYYYKEKPQQAHKHNHDAIQLWYYGCAISCGICEIYTVVKA